MTGGMVTLLVVAGVAVLAVLWFLGMYNGLVRLRMQVRNAWSQIDVQLKRRHDLIPNLVETVKGYAAHERGTFEAVTQARAAAMSAQAGGGVAATAAAEGVLTGALGRLFAVMEAYPQVKANQNFLALQEELSSTENKVGFSRQAYNDAAMAYNTQVETVPANIVAGLGGFKPAEFFQVEQEAERQVPKVSFGQG